MRSSWFFLSTLNYDARPAAHQTTDCKTTGNSLLQTSVTSLQTENPRSGLRRDPDRPDGDAKLFRTDTSFATSCSNKQPLNCAVSPKRPTRPHIQLVPSHSGRNLKSPYSVTGLERLELHVYRPPYSTFTLRDIKQRHCICC